jgi:hypothetical protein
MVAAAVHRGSEEGDVEEARAAGGSVGAEDSFCASKAPPHSMNFRTIAATGTRKSGLSEGNERVVGEAETRRSRLLKSPTRRKISPSDSRQKDPERLAKKNNAKPVKPKVNQR